MSIATNTSVLTSKYISQEIRQQNNEYATDGQKRAGTLADGKTVSDAARGTHIGGNAAAERDVVTISEDARNMQKNGSQEQENGTGSGNVLAPFSGKAQEAKSPSDAAESAREALLKQIQEVKEKIADAKERLAAASANAGVKAGANGESVEEAAMMGLQSAVEVEAIQQEIEQLNQQLQTLYQQLQDQTKGGGGGAPAMGTAGIGGTANGPSGQGERISVTG